MQNHSVAAYYLFTQMICPLFDMSTAAMFIIFFWEIPKYVQALNNIISPLTAWPTWIDILSKWASMLNKLAGDGECSLVPFHAIANFLANEIYHFSRLPQQTGCLFTWAACFR